jgi:hypothetical protein
MLCALIACTLLAAPSARGGERDTFPDLRVDPGPNLRRGIAAVLHAEEAVKRRWPSCEERASPPQGIFSEAPVPADVAGSLGLLRRPQSSAEAALVAPGADTLWLPSDEGVLRSSMRIARTLTDGKQLRVYVTADVSRALPRPEICRTREARETRRRARALPPQARRAAVRLLRQEHAAQRGAEAVPAGPGVYLSASSPGVDLAPDRAGAFPQDLARRGAYAVVRRRGHALLIGLVPDGVERMAIVVARGRSPITDRFYATAPRLSAAVVDNVVAIPVNRPAADVWVARATWQTGDGRAIAVPAGWRELRLTTPSR